MANPVFSKNLRTLTQLPELSVTNIQTLSKGYIELSYPVNADNIDDSTYKYNSYKLNGTTLATVLQSDIFDALRDNNGWVDTFNFSETRDQLCALYYGDQIFTDSAGDFKLKGHHTFIEPPEVLTTISSFTSDVKHRLVNVNSLNLYSRDNSPMFMNKHVGYLTTHHNLENNSTENSTLAPQTDSEKHNVYIFQVVNYTSDSWIAPQSGMFTCYGWLDEYSAALRPDDNATRWVALEINVNADPTKKAEWKILQLQPFVSSEKCSYVGFTFPVKQGAELRIETGFKVGTNSRLYQGVQGSLTNHIANAFVGGVYNAGNEIYDSNTGMENIFYKAQHTLTVDAIDVQSNNYTLEEVAVTVNEMLNQINQQTASLNKYTGKLDDAVNAAEELDALDTRITGNVSTLQSLSSTINKLQTKISDIESQLAGITFDESGSSGGGSSSSPNLSEVTSPYSLAELGEKVNTIIDWINNQ